MIRSSNPHQTEAVLFLRHLILPMSFLSIAHPAPSTILLLNAQVSVGVAGLALGYYTLLREPAPADITSDTENSKHSKLSAGDAAAAGLRAVLPGTVGALPRQPSRTIVDELDAETKRATSGQHWQQQKSQQDR